MNPKSVLHEKLIVQPVFISLLHHRAFMGPCRYGSGEELTYEYDMKHAQDTLKTFNADIEIFVDRQNVDLRETVFFEWNEDFVIRDERIAPVFADDSVDAYLISGTRLISYVSTVIAKRSNKPILFCPLSTSLYSRLGGIDASAHLFALGYKEVFNALDYEELNMYFKILKTRKSLQKTRILYALRNNVISYGAVSSFINLSDVYKRFGIEVLNYNAMELFDVLDNLTEEDVLEAKKMVDQMKTEARGMHLPLEKVLNDVKYYLAVKKVMEDHGCNAFTEPCFEMCATMQLNKREFTFCLTHSLNKDEGIPSACASDIGALICIDILMNIARKAAHMGNCMVRLKHENSLRILHDVASRYMKGYDEEPLPIDYVSFAKGNWGATMRYDFDRDIGESITAINLSPNMDKIMIVKGTITGDNDYLTQECKHAIHFTVKDSGDFHHKEAAFGHHYAWVYGDYTQELIAFAKLMDMEVVLA